MEVNEILVHFDEVLDRVEAGETVPIERDGKVIGLFLPYEGEDMKAEGQEVPLNSP